MTRRTTILHLINTTGPGGAETVFLNLARMVQPARWRSIAVVSEPGWLLDALQRAGVETIVVDDRGLSTVPRYIVTLLRLMTEHEVRLVHGHLFGPSYIASLLGLLRQVPSLGTIHGLPDLEPTERFYRAKLALLSRASRVVFVSAALRDAVLGGGLLPRTRTTVIANGADFTYDPVVGRTRLRTEESGALFVVGAVGNFRPAKAYDIFLRAAALLVRRYPGYRFVVAGEGERTPLGRELSELRDSLGLSDVVRFLGFKPDIRSLMSTLDLYALTSRTEGFSLSTIEAMGAGLPVVATRCGGPEGIVDDGVTGLLVTNESPDAIAEAIEFLRLHPEHRNDMAQRARESVVARFSLDAQIAAYERLYDEVLAES